MNTGECRGFASRIVVKLSSFPPVNIPVAHTYSFQYILSIGTKFHEQSDFPASVAINSIHLLMKKY
jgi:hypothetical protein